jgi:hypothetical protein
MCHHFAFDFYDVRCVLLCLLQQCVSAIEAADTYIALRYSRKQTLGAFL